MGLRILIADDEAIIRLGLRAMLIDLGHQVVAAARDGQQAIEMAREHHPDLAFLDVKMPRKDGLEAAAEISQEHPIPIILLTAYSDAQTISRAREGDVLGYLVKPVKESDLAPTIAVAQARFREKMTLGGEHASLVEAEQTRATVDQAKARLMAEAGLTEPDAYKYIHFTSRRERRTMRQVAERILGAPSVAEIIAPTADGA